MAEPRKRKPTADILSDVVSDPTADAPVILTGTKRGGQGITYVDPSVTDAQTKYHLAKARYYEAQADGQLIDNETAGALATSAKIATHREEMKEVWEGASNGRNRAYHFTDVVDGDNVDRAVDVLNRWQRLDAGHPERPWRFIICSGGGSVTAGMKLYATLKSVAAQRPLITVASGFCASMATVIHQTGTLRLIEPGCSYMIHDVSGNVDGALGNMQDTMKWLEKLNHQLHIALAEKSVKTIEEIAEMSRRQDSWFMPEEVVEAGFADRIGYAMEDI